MVKKVVFYRTAAANEPVREWLRSLSDEDSRTIGVDLKTVQFGWPLGMPLCRPLGKGLCELRSSLSGNRIARLMFFLDNDRICVVNGFIKKTQKTPLEEIELARRRMKEWCDD
jgi:phage-related protein